jgi:hypothetical protein
MDDTTLESTIAYMDHAWKEHEAELSSDAENALAAGEPQKTSVE